MAISDLTSGLTSLSNLILVTPNSNIGYQPQSENGSAPPPTIVFDYDGEQTVSLESDITDHYSEDNTPREDQIALKPEIVTTHGFIGELNDITPGILIPLKIAAEKLTIIGGYTPGLSLTAQLAYNEALFAYRLAKTTVNSVVSAVAGLDSVLGLGLGVSPNQTRQQVWFQLFYNYWVAKTLFTVQTPWIVYKNMAIKSLRAIQEADSSVITDFEVSFKAMRFASLSSTFVNDKQLQGRLKYQSAIVVNNASASPLGETVNLLDKISEVVG